MDGDEVGRVLITAGKQDEFDTTETNHAIVRLKDTDNQFEPFIPDFPATGSLHGKQILLQLYNPVTNAWHERFRGVIDEWGYDLNPSTRGGASMLSNVSISCVGIFDYLSGFELIAGVHGDPPPAGIEDVVFYEGAPLVTKEVDDRIIALLTDAGIDSTRYVVFSGNVNVQESRYDSGDALLVALRDAADAESPAALANIYEDRHGRFVFHGRQARLDPETVALTGNWDFQQFLIGDGASISGDSNYAQIRPPFQYRVARNRIVNAALVIPRGIDRTTIPSLVFTSPSSISNYGTHPFTYQDSINAGHKTNGDTASQDCLKSATFLVQNYSNPQVRIDALTLKAMHPSDARAAKTWEVMSKSDIADMVTVGVTYPGNVGGVFDDFFIEGFTQTITPLNPTHDMVELSLNVSPQPGSNPYDDG
jgi:hypothetical protein